MGVTSLQLSQKDLVALHYRHVANSVVRSLQAGNSSEDIALNRARGYACSSLDPVTGGRHCSIGGDPAHEFLVTSTLASQASPALGRALGIPFAHALLGNDARFSPDAISYVSLGDGSASNGHFLSALNAAKFAQHNGVKCPLLFVISDNDISISLRGNGFLTAQMAQLGGLHKESADGRDFLALHAAAGRAVDFVRTFQRPALLHVHSLPRRFGHAATDRQAAYLSEAEIRAAVGCDPLSDAFAVLAALGVYQAGEVDSLFERLQGEVARAFDVATEEPKLTNREALVASNSAPLFRPPGQPLPAQVVTRRLGQKGEEGQGQGPREVMRKHMTRFFDDLLAAHREAVYLGEDVRHGGYYLVTDGLARKYPRRVLDFPPDETSLVGAGQGLAQAGLLPVVEIPYAKYLDCGLDALQEVAIAHWLSAGRQPAGLLLRLQGFDRGIFGGNFHTHNALSFLAPGLDVVCFSNGRDYVRGLRFAAEQARRGRVVATVDSTDLLNRRHLSEADRDELLLTHYPEPSETDPEGGYDFDQVVVYPPPESEGKSEEGTVVIVSYGNGVPTSLLAQRALTRARPQLSVVVVDSPCLSQTPAGLLAFLRDHRETLRGVVFADVCKFAPGMPLAKAAVDCQNAGLLDGLHWRCVGAAPTYNPLGSHLTFLSVEDIVTAAQALV